MSPTWLSLPKETVNRQVQMKNLTAVLQYNYYYYKVVLF